MHVFFYYHTMNSQRNSHPLIFLYASIIMGIQISKTALFIHGVLLHSIGKNKEDGKEGKESGKDAVKKGVLAILKESYDIEEEDFISAELEVVPAGKAKEAGFDRSMILAYGQVPRFRFPLYLPECSKPSFPLPRFPASPSNNKFTGARGKSGSNDANAEYLGHIRSIFEKEKVHFQTAELGRVDLGGGGTIAYILALYGMNVIDSGVAVLNMHALASL